MIKASLVDKRDLTAREGEILSMICQGLSDKVISQQLGISTKTISIHCEHIYEKLQVRRHSVNVRCAAIAEAIARGMVRVSSTLICFLLMVSLCGSRDQVARVGRVSARPVVSRVLNREV